MFAVQMINAGESNEQYVIVHEIDLETKLKFKSFEITFYQSIELTSAKREPNRNIISFTTYFFWNEILYITVSFDSAFETESRLFK